MTQTRTPPRAAGTRPPPLQPPSGRIRLTGRGAMLSLFAISFSGLLIAAITGWNLLADALFMMSCGLVAWYTKSSGMRLLVVCPPLVFLAGTIAAQVITASGALVALERIFVTLGIAAPWLFTGTALTLAIAFGRGWRPQMLDHGPIASMREAVRDAWPSRSSNRWTRSRLAG